MATLQIATPFTQLNVPRKRGSVADMRGRKAMRVSCQQSSVPASAEGRSSGCSQSDSNQEAVNILQSSRSPLLNLSPEDWIAAFDDKENVADRDRAGVASVTEPHHSSPGFEANKLQQGQRRRSERVNFTAEKARLLRKELRATQTFHDKWYHSAIASKLASPE